MKFSGKRILITGASSGIGESFAYLTAKDGAEVIIAARRKEKLEAVKRKIEELGGKGIVIETDVTDPVQVKQLFLEATKGDKKLDLVFNNAGLGFVAPIDNFKIEDIKKIVDVNVFGMIVVSKYAAEVMKRQECGHIIMTASLASFLALEQWSVYAASKFAINGFAKAIRQDLRKYNIKVTTLHPGIVDTEFYNKKKADIEVKNLGSSITAEQVAQSVYKAAFTNKKQILVPNSTKLFAFLSRHFQDLTDIIIRIYSRSIKYGAKTEDEKEFDYITRKCKN